MKWLALSILPSSLFWRHNIYAFLVAACCFSWPFCPKSFVKFRETTNKKFLYLLLIITLFFLLSPKNDLLNGFSIMGILVLGMIGNRVIFFDPNILLFFRRGFFITIALLGLDILLNYPIQSFKHDPCRAHTYSKILQSLVLAFWGIRVSKQNRVLMALGMGMLFFVFHESDTTVLALIGGILTYLMVLKFKDTFLRWLQWGGGFLAFTCPIIAYFLFSPHFIGLFPWIKTLHISYIHRISFYHWAAERILEHPFMGYGWGMTASLSTRIPVPKIPWDAFCVPETTFFAPHLHNAFLQIWLETGFFGALILVSVIFKAFDYARKHIESPEQKACMAAYVVSVICISAVNYPLTRSWWVATLVFFLPYVTASAFNVPEFAERIRTGRIRPRKSSDDKGIRTGR